MKLRSKQIVDFVSRVLVIVQPLLAAKQDALGDIKTISADYTTLSNDYVLNCDTSVSDINITLTTPSEIKLLEIRKISNANILNIIPASGTINGVSQLSIKYKNNSASLLFNGSDWQIK